MIPLIQIGLEKHYVRHNRSPRRILQPQPRCYHPRGLRFPTVELASRAQRVVANAIQIPVLPVHQCHKLCAPSLACLYYANRRRGTHLGAILVLHESQPPTRLLIAYSWSRKIDLRTPVRHIRGPTVAAIERHLGGLQMDFLNRLGVRFRRRTRGCLQRAWQKLTVDIVGNIVLVEIEDLIS